MNKLRFGYTLLYRLKRDFGETVDIYRSTGQTIDLETGRLVTSKTKLKIRRAILLPSRVARDYIKEIGYSSDSKNAKYQGIFDSTQRFLVIDRHDLKGIFKTLTTADWIVFNHMRWEISEIDLFEQNTAYWLIIKKVTGATKYEIHTRDLREKLVFTEEKTIERP